MSTRRTLLIATQALPYKSEVNYIKPATLSFVEQYTTRIDTGVSPTINTTVHIKFNAENYNGGDQLCGARTGTSNENRFFTFALSQKRSVLGNSVYTGVAELGADTEILFNEYSTHRLYVNGAYIGYLCTSYIAANNNHLMLFATSGYEPNYGTSNSRIYWCKIYDADTLIRAFIPVIDFNNTPCMYDKVSKQLFYNQGTGGFTYG